MRPIWLLTAAVALVLGVTWSLRHWTSHTGDGVTDPRGKEASPDGPPPPRRIVSLAPSTTEVLFALGVGESVVGVTRYCRYPPEARDRVILGGYLDPDFERLVALDPDLVVLARYRGHEGLHHRLSALGFRTLVVPNETIEDILTSIRSIGEHTGRSARAAEILADMSRRLERLRKRIGERPRPRVLVCIDRQVGTGTLREIHAAGSATFYDEILRASGGRNVCERSGIRYPRLSPENLLDLDPEVILDLVPRDRHNGLSESRLLSDWDALGDLAAVESGRVYLIEEDHAFIPGPRIVLFLETVASLLHPEAADPPVEGRPDTR